MPELGYALSGEEHSANDLVRYAQRAEQAGFDFAQVAATIETIMPGRFFLGLGSGENLNEHIVGEGRPPAAIRLEMLEEAIERAFSGFTSVKSCPN